MDQTTWLFLGTGAAAVSAGVFLTRLDEIIWALAAALLWTLWAYGATNVEIYGETAKIATRSYTALAIMGTALAALMAVVWLKGTALALHPDRDQQGGPASPAEDIRQ